MLLLDIMRKELGEDSPSGISSVHDLDMLLCPVLEARIPPQTVRPSPVLARFLVKRSGGAGWVNVEKNRFGGGSLGLCESSGRGEGESVVFRDEALLSALGAELEKDAGRVGKVLWTLPDPPKDFPHSAGFLSSREGSLSFETTRDREVQLLTTFPVAVHLGTPSAKFLGRGEDLMRGRASFPLKSVWTHDTRAVYDSEIVGGMVDARAVVAMEVFSGARVSAGDLVAMCWEEGRTLFLYRYPSTGRLSVYCLAYSHGGSSGMMRRRHGGKGSSKEGLRRLELASAYALSSALVFMPGVDGESVVEGLRAACAAGGFTTK